MSSSAQLTLLPWLLDWEPEPDRTTFAASLHAGSALGLLTFFAMNGIRTGAADPSGTPADSVHAARGVGLALAAVPAAVAGALLQDKVERRLGSPRATAALLGGAGALMWLADRRPEDRHLTRSALAATSFAQGAALAPGVSRSGAAYTALRACRVGRQDAYRLSMQMGLPITVGAAALTTWRARARPELLPTALAGAAAFVTARSVKGGSQRTITGAAIYRLSVAALVALRLRRESRP